MDPCDMWVWDIINKFALAKNCVLMSRTLLSYCQNCLWMANLSATLVHMLLWSALEKEGDDGFSSVLLTWQLARHNTGMCVHTHTHTSLHTHFHHIFLIWKLWMLLDSKLLLGDIFVLMFFFFLSKSVCHTLNSLWKKNICLKVKVTIPLKRFQL